MTITLYPDFMGYKRNGYEVDVEMQYCMGKSFTWYKDNINFKINLIKTGEN
jgi:hypothetical protein